MKIAVLTTFPGLYGRDFPFCFHNAPAPVTPDGCTESGCRAFFQDAFMTILSGKPCHSVTGEYARSTLHRPGQHKQRTRRRRYLLNWLDTARQMREFRGMAEEFTTLRKLLAT